MFNKVNVNGIFKYDDFNEQFIFRYLNFDS